MVQQPTRVQVLSALIWKCSVAAAVASRSKSGSKRPRQSLLSWAINLRTKLEPPMSEHSLGNMIVSPLIMKNSEKDDLAGYVCQLKKTIQEFGDKYVKNLQRQDAGSVIVDIFSGVGREMAKAGRDVDSYVYSSVCRLGFYDIDFGWGRPTWNAIVLAHDTPNMLMLADTFDGEGVEAQVSLPEEEMAFFERDPELLEFASVNPSPLQQHKKLHNLSPS